MRPPGGGSGAAEAGPRAICFNSLIEFVLLGFSSLKERLGWIYTMFL